MPIPKWTKPPVPIPVSDMREFVAKYGPDVAVLTTWTAETKSYQFITIGSNQDYADGAVRLRNVLATNLGLVSLGPTTEDLRHEHPNVSLTHEELFMLLWMLGYLNADSKLDKEHLALFEKHHDALLEKFGAAFERKHPE